MTAGRITRGSNTTLGLKFGVQRQPASDGFQNVAWGWALLVHPPRPTGRIKRGNPGDLAREAASRWNPGDGPFTLYRYRTDNAFAQSIAARDGMTRLDHIVHVETIAAELADEGFDVHICEVR